jgi:hypothetical protein
MSPFLSRVGALGVNDCRCGACFASRGFAHCDINGLVDALQCAVPIPKLKREMRRGFRQGLPLAAGRKQIINRNDRVEHFATSTERLRARADSKAQ